MSINSISLFEFTLMLETFIGDSFSSKYFWITAEVSSVSIKKGHCYLNLIEKETNSNIAKAEMKAIIWSKSFEKINQNFAEVTGFELKKDINILFLATLNYNPKYGLSLIVFDIKPEFTLGELLIERHKTILKLKKLNLYDKNKQLEFPLVPQKIAVFSAADSKGYEDFINNLQKNPYSYKFQFTLFSVLLQGNYASANIVQQLNKFKVISADYDIAVLIRGGGSRVDLLCFDDYILSEAIANCSIPLITGIGHTTDISVADEVAYVSCETPLAVANYLVNKCKDFEDSLLANFKTINFQSLKLIDYNKNSLHKYSNSIGLNFKFFVKNEITKMNYLINNLQKNVSNQINNENAFVDFKIQSKFKYSKQFLLKEIESLSNIESILMSNDPKIQLQKGYSLTKINGKYIKNLESVNIDDEIETTIFDGKITSKVKTLTK